MMAVMPSPSHATPVVAIVGATGAVGVELIRCLEERRFPLSELRLFASARSAGKTLNFRGAPLTVRELTADSFRGVNLALFSAGASRSKEFAPLAVRAGAVVIDNSSAFRMDPQVPLVVMTGRDDDNIVAEAMREGAQDFLVKVQIETRALVKLRSLGQVR